MGIFFTILLVALAVGPCGVPAFGLEILTRELPVAVLNRPYGAEPLTVSGGGQCTENGPSFRVIAGALPDGLRLTPAGYWEGIPKTEGIYWFTVRVANSCQATSRVYSLRVDGMPILVASEQSL